MQRNDDEAWQAIVENYGEVPQVSDEAVTSADDPVGPVGPVAPVGPTPRSPDEDNWGPGLPDLDDERFVPPEPPPVPRPSRDRAVAWAGVFGSPAVLLICLLLGVALPSFVAYVLVAGFVGGFCYLVWQMPRGPRDPYDDGAVV